jgi:hypothetical protein
MSGKPFVAVAVATSVSMLAIVSAVAASDNRGDRGGREHSVLPCSLDGVNPVYHPEIFGSAAAAASYGFVRSPNGTWQVRPGCRR